MEEYDTKVAQVDTSRIYKIGNELIANALYELLALDDYRYPNGIFEIKKGQKSQVTGLLAKLILKKSKGKVVLSSEYNKVVQEDNKLKSAVKEALEDMAKNKKLSDNAITKSNMITDDEVEEKPKTKK